MIKLNRLNGFEIVINPELIEWIEANPDTTITLATGTKIIVKNSMEVVIEKVMEYRKKLYAEGTRPAETLLKHFIKETK